MATPLLRSLKSSWPTCHISVAGKSPFQDLLAGLDSVDAFLPLTNRSAEASVLRQAQAEVGVILPHSWSSALAAWRAGIPHRLGRRHHGRQMLFSSSLQPIPAPRPMTELYADFLPPLGLARQVPPAELVVHAPLRTSLPQQPLLAVAPGAAFGPSKIYPPSLLRQVLQELHQARGIHPVLLGASEEYVGLQELGQSLGFGFTLPAPPHRGLDEAKAILKKVDVFLGADNGARHIAAAVGTPQVVLYGPTHPAWSAHGLEKTILVRREELHCLQCHHKVCPLANHPCMAELSPQHVVEAVLNAFANWTSSS